jgi:hypothetical protein
MRLRNVEEKEGNFKLSSSVFVEKTLKSRLIRIPNSNAIEVEITNKLAHKNAWIIFIHAFFYIVVLQLTTHLLV